MKRRNNVKEIVLSMPFFAVLFYISIIGFIFPLRPTVSISEKRSLEKFPDFSFSSFFSGSYFDEITNWYSDTFPGREGWIKINKVTSSLHGFNFTSVDVSHFKDNDEIPDSTQSPAAASPSEDTVSPTLEPSPSPTAFSMKEQATEFSEIDPDKVDIELYSGSIQIDGTVYAYQGFSKNASDNYLKYINKFAETCKNNNINVYDVIAPTSVGIILPDKTREEIDCADQGKIIEYIAANVADNVRCANTYDYIKAHSNEYVYYHADHHWTGLGAYYGYLAFCESANLSPISLDEYEVLEQGEFSGSFVAAASLSGKIKKDTVTAYKPSGNIYQLEPSWNGEMTKSDVVVDQTNAAISNKYNAYLGGDKRLCILVNDDLDDSYPSCIVLKDSFGNPFSIYLSKHYKNVYVVDYRKMDFGLMDFAVENGIEDIIICQSIGVSQSNSANGLLDQDLNGYSWQQ